MLKSVGKFTWRMCKCVIGVTAIGFGGYYISMGLNWLTGYIMEFLAKAAKYLMGNWVAVILVILALIIGGLAFDGVADSIRKKKARKKAAHESDEA